MSRNSRKSSDLKPGTDDGSDSFETYLEYNRVLRTWFVAFGVGGPALFLVNDNLAKRFVEAELLQCVVILFLIGAASQVIGAFINKVANYYVYLSQVDDQNKTRWCYRIAEWVVEQFWFDVLLDVLTIGVFGWAAWLLLTVFTNTS